MQEGLITQQSLPPRLPFLPSLPTPPLSTILVDPVAGELLWGSTTLPAAWDWLSASGHIQGQFHDRHCSCEPLLTRSPKHPLHFA